MLSLAALVVFAFGPAEEIDLFNGKDLTGWKAVFQDEKDIPENVKKRLKLPAKMEDVWKVENGVLVCKGQPYGYLATEKEFENFDLTLEWRWKSEGRRPGNSGVLLWINDEDKVWPRSIEAQLAAGDAGDIWVILPAKIDIPKEQKVGKRRYQRTVKENIEKPIGEWNKYEIHCKNGDVKLTINGKLVNEGKNSEPRKGRLGLQSEGTEIHFRNIKVKTAE
jgi:3-keto-disaccharide hydrolase